MRFYIIDDDLDKSEVFKEILGVSFPDSTIVIITEGDLHNISQALQETQKDQVVVFLDDSIGGESIYGMISKEFSEILILGHSSIEQDYIPKKNRFNKNDEGWDDGRMLKRIQGLIDTHISEQ